MFETEIVVTAERGENDPRTLTVSTAVLTRREIEVRPGATLAEALEMLPGFQMVFASGTGFRPTTIARGFFGGGEAEYVKLLVDGVPVGDPESGLIDWRTVTAMAIERVEALRGPASALYGDASLGGVVQVFTSGPDTQRGRVAADGGRLGQRFVSAAYRQPMQGSAIDLLASHARATGYRARSAVRETAGSIAANRRGRSSHMTARASFDHVHRDEPGALTPAQIALDPRASDPLFQHDREGRRRGYAAVRYASTGGRFVYNATAHAGVRSGTRLRTVLLAPDFGDRAHRDIFTNTTGVSVESSLDTRFAGLGGEFRSGGDLSRDRIDTAYRAVGANGDIGSERARFEGRRAKVAAYATQRVELHSRVRIDAGVRWDRIGDAWMVGAASHTAWSPRAGATLLLGPSSRPTAVFAHASGSFKAATLEQLFDPRPFPDFQGGTFVISNPTLRPQRGKSIEGGVRQSAGAYRWEIVLYRMWMTDEIDFDPATFSYANIGRSTHSGAEIDAALLATAAVSAGLSYAFTRVAPDSAPAAEQLKNIPRHLLRPHITLSLPYETSFHARYVRTAGAFADDANRIALGDRSTVDVRIAKSFSKATVRIDLINLTNDRYEEVGYVLSDFRGGIVPFLYPAPGFSFRTGMEFRF